MDYAERKGVENGERARVGSSIVGRAVESTDRQACRQAGAGMRRGYHLTKEKRWW